jgi:hypothetical protein
MAIGLAIKPFWPRLKPRISRPSIKAFGRCVSFVKRSIVYLLDAGAVDAAGFFLILVHYFQISLAQVGRQATVRMEQLKGSKDLRPPDLNSSQNRFQPINLDRL